MTAPDLLSPEDFAITIHQGATFELDLAYEDPDGNAADLTGFTVSGQLWNRTGTSKIANFDTPWTVQASGMFKLRLDSSVTSGITEQGQYDVMFIEPSGDRYYILQGVAFLDLGLTGRGL